LPAPSTPRPRNLFARGSWLESSRTADILRAESTGGILLIVAAAIGLAWANSPWHASYNTLHDFAFGTHRLHLHLTLTEWASDGLLAVFFFVAGLELKREFVAGDLRDPRRAALPVAAAVGGMAVPALIYTAVNLAHPDGAPIGWAIPSATDIAFAVAVLAAISTHLPSGLRTFLLTLAVVDDLLAIVVIAVFYSSSLHLLWLLAALVPIAVFAVLVQRRIWNDFLLVPLAVAAWVLVHASGIHPTVAGVLLAFSVPVRRRDQAPGKGLAEHLEQINRPISAGLAVPVFAFFAAGVTVGGWHGITEAAQDPVTLGIVLGLVVGKCVGITLATWLLARFTSARLDDELAWIDVIGMAILGGIGFTVSLLIGELAFGRSAHGEHAKVGVLFGSLAAAVLASIVLRSRNRVYRRIGSAEQSAQPAVDRTEPEGSPWPPNP
jgi:NhaA family Na+:H+ antiporter